MTAAVAYTDRELIGQALEAMGQEPWCFGPERIARLTDWQVLDFYLKPAEKRADKFKRQNNPDAPLGLPTETLEEAKAKADAAGIGGMDQPPPRQTVVGMYMLCGVPEDVANKKYEEQLAAWRKAKGAT